MTATTTFVIVGASLAGAKAAEALREAGFDGRIVLVGEEAVRPYERPPLSKDYLQGKVELESIHVHPASWYEEHGVELRLATRVVAIERGAHAVVTEVGDRIAYDRLLLTTGSSPLPLPVPGGTAPGVLYLRRVEDSERLRTAFASAGRVVIVGGGWIGLETAAAARLAGAQVTVLEALELPLLRVLGPECARVFAELHRRHGVEIRGNQRVEEVVLRDGRPAGVRLAGGERVAADAVVVGIGIRPNVELAQSAGLEVENGIKVDSSLRTGDPDIFAAGDVANAYNTLLGRHLRIEHWENAIEQPKLAARAMMGEAVQWDRVPYFYTDQYELGMEYAGWIQPPDYDEVVFRGHVERMEFVAFWLVGGRVAAGMNVNVWDVNDAIKDLVRSRSQVERAHLADPSVPLEALVPH